MYQYSLRKAQEHREEKRREQEFHNAQLLSYFKGQMALQHACEATEKAEAQAQRTKMRQIIYEQKLLDKMEKAENEFAAKQRAAEEAQVNDAQKEKAALEAERAAKERQRIVSESVELSELRSLLQAAHVKKERDNQLLQKAQRHQAVQEEDRSFHKAKAAEVAEAAAREQAVGLEKLSRERKAHEVLKLQLRYKAILEEQAKDALAQERRIVDAAARREEEEDAEAAEESRVKAEQQRAFIQQYLRERQQAILNQELDRAAEDAEIQEFQERQCLREAEIAALRAAKRARAEERCESIKGRREAEMKAAEEEQRLIDLLRAEEVEAAAAEAAVARKEKRLAMQREMAEANRLQICLREEQDEQRRIEEESFRQQLLARFAEEDRIEQMNASKRRLRLEQHKREAERLVSEKRLLEKAEREMEATERAAVESLERRKREIIQEERERLLAESGELLQYLPHAVVANKERLPPLTPAFLD